MVVPLRELLLSSSTVIIKLCKHTSLPDVFGMSMRVGRAHLGAAMVTIERRSRHSTISLEAVSNDHIVCLLRETPCIPHCASPMLPRIEYIDPSSISSESGNGLHVSGASSPDEAHSLIKARFTISQHRSLNTRILRLLLN